MTHVAGPLYHRLMTEAGQNGSIFATWEEAVRRTQCDAVDAPERCDDLFETRIEVVEDHGEWSVHVVEEDEERIYSFVLESFALAFAEGQRMRLKLADFMRL